MSQPKLTDEQVREIRRRWVDGRRHERGYIDSQTSLAKEFGVTQATISLAARRRLYRRVKA